MACFKKAAEADRRRPEPWLNVGELYKLAGRLEEAEVALRKCVSLGPTWPLAHFNLANVLKDLDRNEESLAAYQEALELDPPFKAAIFNNMALVHGTLNQNDLVIASYEKAMRIDPRVPETHNNLASYYQAVGDMTNAVKHYKQAVQLKPDKGFLLNLAYALGAKGETAESLKVYMKTIEMFPDYALAYYNLGTSLMGEERYAESEYCYRWAVKLDGTRADYYNNLATVVGASGATHEVMEIYDIVLRLHPGHETAYCNMYHTKHEICDWSNVDSHLKKVVAIVNRQLKEGRVPTVRAFHALAYAVSADFVRRLSEAWSSLAEKEALMMVPKNFAFPMPPTSPAPRRIRVGYTSSDLKKQHPVAHLVLSMFLLHDLLSFEVFCFALSPSDSSEIRLQVERGAQHFIDLTPALSKSLVAAAEEVNRHKPHILINLNGYTNGGRLEMYALRPAPIQVHGIGYPGTLGATYVGHMITDRISSPPEAVEGYTEHLVLMPNSYLMNSLKNSYPHLLHPRYRPSEERNELLKTDPLHSKVQQDGEVKAYRRLEMETAVFVGVQRDDWDLPNKKVVYACFNTLIKLRPRILKRWKRILDRVPNSVIWLLRAPQVAEEKVMQWWREAGDYEERIIFTGTAAKEEHVKRAGLADIFLDTDIYGAHSTGTDALWAGLPLLSPTHLLGMASRVSASLLSTIGLEEMIGRTLDEYENLAVALGRNPRKLLEIRHRLRHERWNSSLFDTRRWMEDWEKGITMLWSAYVGRAEGMIHRNMHVVLAR
uniref:protein O-GlcNAc transferase n=1 Tax=Guillardia theta TaxID=55529 RepID=A0A7S4ULL8_GUITH